jgi:hypothetical protein
MLMNPKKGGLKIPRSTRPGKSSCWLSENAKIREMVEREPNAAAMGHKLKYAADAIYNKYYRRPILRHPDKLLLAELATGLARQNGLTLTNANKRTKEALNVWFCRNFGDWLNLDVSVIVDIAVGLIPDPPQSQPHKKPEALEEIVQAEAEDAHCECGGEGEDACIEASSEHHVPCSGEGERHRRKRREYRGDGEGVNGA